MRADGSDPHYQIERNRRTELKPQVSIKKIGVSNNAITANVKNLTQKRCHIIGHITEASCEH